MGACVRASVHRRAGCHVRNVRLSCSCDKMVVIECKYPGLSCVQAYVVMPCGRNTPYLPRKPVGTT
jgi:hypothetical protein